jgi:hypothetical protein
MKHIHAPIIKSHESANRFTHSFNKVRYTHAFPPPSLPVNGATITKASNPDRGVAAAIVVH